MATRGPLRVRQAPAKALMIYDGNCNFCKFWIARWRRATAGRVDYLAAQDPRVGEQFPELPPEMLEHAVQLVESDGNVYSGAEAVFRSLTRTRRGGAWLWLYRQVPGFGWVADRVYRFVSAHREWFSRLTRFFLRGGRWPDE